MKKEHDLLQKKLAEEEAKRKKANELTPEQVEAKKAAVEKKAFDKEEESFENDMLLLVNR